LHPIFAQNLATPIEFGEVVPVDWLFVELFCPYCKSFICNKLQETKALAKQPPHAFPGRWVELVAAAR